MFAPSPIARVMQPFIDDQTIPGVVTLVATRARVLAFDALGWADVADRIPMRTDHLHWIASMSKPIAGTALMMLVDEGKVNVNDSVEHYLPEFCGQWLTVERDDEHALLRKPLRPITVRDILTHTSGLPFKSPIETPTLDLLPLKTVVGSYAMLPLDFEPGGKYQYSNA
ncbi:MAG: beta-lactamase family protein, partial [bacterium]|nr:beta-lactamase family protein [bacterium]